MEVNSTATTGKPKTKIKGNKKAEKEKDSKGKISKGKGKDSAVLNYSKFEGQGLNFKCKLFGFVEVPGPRGDKSSVEAIQKLKQQAKQLKKGANEHKLKITFNVTLQGIKIINEKTQTVAHQHQIHKISFISHDPEDRHVFGYIYSPPRSADTKRKYFLFAIKSEKTADAITCQLYELFQVVYKLQENTKAQNKDVSSQHQKTHEKSVQPLEPLQDKMLLEMSSKLGGEHHQTEEHLYAEPTFVQTSPSVPAKTHHYSTPSDRPSQTYSESQQVEGTPGKNGVDEIESETLSSSSALSSSRQDPFSSETEVTEPNKEINSVSQIFSDNVFTPSTNEDSGFDPDFDSAAATEQRFDDSIQFNAEFPPYKNGLTSGELEGHHEESQAAFAATSSPLPTIPQFENSETKNDEVAVKSTSTGSLNVNDESQTEGEKEENVPSPPEVNAPQVEDLSTFSSNISSNQQEKSSSQELNNCPIVLSFGKEAKETDMLKSETENKFSSTNLFETKFDTESYKSVAAENNEGVFPSFSSGTDVFPNDDPFSSSSTLDQEKTTSFGEFSHDDPFSSQGGTNSQIISDPFAESDNLFSADFSTMSNNEEPFGSQEGVVFPVVRQEPEELVVDNQEDVFEAAFEANMEKGLEEDTREQHDENLTDDIGSIEKQEDVKKTTEENEKMHESIKNDIEKVNVEDNPPESVVNNIENIIDDTVLNQPPEEQGGSVNAFDMSPNDDYVTLKTAARPLSPTEFSPPPLPPRPSFPTFEQTNTAAVRKEPPALPPRPSNQSLNTERQLRKPPELPPRVDLEENHEVLSENMDDNNAEQPNEALFSADFASFDFNNVENNVDTSLQQQEHEEFDMGDPFTDPFHGTDPFQTPIASDPFSSRHNSKSFDPFSDDPFTTTLTFDEADDDSKKFADFSDFSPFNE